MTAMASLWEDIPDNVSALILIICLATPYVFFIFKKVGRRHFFETIVFEAFGIPMIIYKLHLWPYSQKTFMICLVVSMVFSVLGFCAIELKFHKGIAKEKKVTLKNSMLGITLLGFVMLLLILTN